MLWCSPHGYAFANKTFCMESHASAIAICLASIFGSQQILQNMKYAISKHLVEQTIDTLVSSCGSGVRYWVICMLERNIGPPYIFVYESMFTSNTKKKLSNSCMLHHVISMPRVNIHTSRRPRRYIGFSPFNKIASYRILTIIQSHLMSCSYDYRMLHVVVWFPPSHANIFVSTTHCYTGFNYVTGHPTFHLSLDWNEAYKCRENCRGLSSLGSPDCMKIWNGILYKWL